MLQQMTTQQVFSTSKEEEVAVLFTQHNCKFCKIVEQQLLTKFVKGVKIAKLNIDNEPEIDFGTKFSLMSTPTIIVFKDEETVERFDGQASMGRFIQKYL